MCSPCCSIYEAIKAAIMQTTSKLNDIELCSFSNTSNGGSGNIATTEDEASGFVIVGEKKQRTSIPTEGETTFMKDDDTPAPVLSWRLTAAVPVCMKQSQAVLWNSLLHVGGGFTGNALSDSTIYTYDHSFELWGSLPVAPLKWFAIAVFRGELILIGGKLVKHARLEYTNKIATWDGAAKLWKFSLPVMQSARLQPCAFTTERYLAVAGGQRSVLDFDVEVLDSHTMQWHRGAQLPIKAFPNRSVLFGESWYVLDADGLDGDIYRFHIPSLIEYILPASQRDASDSNQPWTILAGPQAHSLSIAEVGGMLLALTKSSTKDRMLQAQVYCPERNEWLTVGRLPPLSNTASPVSLRDGGLLLIGGNTNEGHYSSKMYKATLFSASEASRRKLHVSFY